MASLKIALVGNPNTGKSSLFNALTGLNQRVGNFPGVTVDRKAGAFRLPNRAGVAVIDLPGTYGLYPSAEDERITVDVLRRANDPDHPEVVVVVADATNLKPSLLICTQVIDLGFRTVLALNMADQVPRYGLEIDDRALERLLGVPVVRTSALKGRGISDLKDLLAQGVPLPRRTHFRLPEGLLPAVQEVRRQYGLSSDYLAYQYLLAPPFHLPELRERRAALGMAGAQDLISNEIVVRYDRISDLLAEAVRETADPHRRLSARLDALLLHPLWGYAALVALLFLMFQAIFTWAAYPMEWLDAGMAALGGAVETALMPGLARDFIVKGLIAGVQGIIVFVPQIALLFLFLAMLEETGYMSRAVFLMDRLMRRFGLSGKSVVPLFGGFACAVPSIMAVRSIPHPRERLLTILITPLMSCSARIPVYTVLIAVFIPAAAGLGPFNLRGVVMAGFYALGIIVAALVALALKRWLPGGGAGQDGLFFTELPNYRMPRWKNVAIDIQNKVRAFVWDAGRVILVLSLVLWLLASFGPAREYEAIERRYAVARALPEANAPALAQAEAAEKLQHSWAGHLGRTLEPAIRPLGYDWKIGIALISSFAAREVFVSTMNTIYSLGEADDETTGYRLLSERLRAERDARTGAPVYTVATALSLLVFYALAMQCMSTLAVVRRETNSWRWPAFMLVYQSGLAYALAAATYWAFS